METKQQEKCGHLFSGWEDIIMEGYDEFQISISCDECGACFTGQCFLEPTEE